MLLSHQNPSPKLKALTKTWTLLVLILIGTLAADKFVTSEVEPMLSQQNIDSFCLNGEVTKPKPPREQTKLISLSSSLTTNTLEKTLLKKQRVFFRGFNKIAKNTEPLKLYQKNLKAHKPSRAPPVLS